MERYTFVTKPAIAAHHIGGKSAKSKTQPCKVDPYPASDAAKEKERDAWKKDKRMRKIMEALREVEEERALTLPSGGRKAPSTPSANPNGCENFASGSRRNIGAIPAHQRTLNVAYTPTIKPSTLVHTGILPTKSMPKDLFDLKDERNPITHNAALKPVESIQSCSTGHQRGGPSHNRSYFQDQKKKLKDQMNPGLEDSNKSKEKGILSGLRIYINGYTSATTHLELVHLVGKHGGSNLRSDASATHIITSQGLSGSKTQKYLNGKSRIKYHVVKPEWLFDTIKAKKRMNEWDYSVVKSDVQGDLRDIFPKVGKGP